MYPIDYRHQASYSLKRWWPNIPIYASWGFDEFPFYPYTSSFKTKSYPWYVYIYIYTYTFRHIIIYWMLVGHTDIGFLLLLREPSAWICKSMYLRQTPLVLMWKISRKRLITMKQFPRYPAQTEISQTMSVKNKLIIWQIVRECFTKYDCMIEYFCVHRKGSEWNKSHG